MNFNISKQQGKIATHLESPWTLPALMEHKVKTKASTAINENTGWIKFFTNLSPLLRISRRCMYSCKKIYLGLALYSFDRIIRQPS